MLILTWNKLDVTVLVFFIILIKFIAGVYIFQNNALHPDWPLIIRFCRPCPSCIFFPHTSPFQDFLLNFISYEHIHVQIQMQRFYCSGSGSDSNSWGFSLKIIFQVLVQDQVQDQIPSYSISFPMSIFMFRFRCRGSIGFQSWLQVLIQVSVCGLGSITLTQCLQH